LADVTAADSWASDRVLAMVKVLLCDAHCPDGGIGEQTDLRAGRSPIDVRGLVDRALLREVLLDTARTPDAETAFVDTAGFIGVRDAARETTGLAGGVTRVACG